MRRRSFLLTLALPFLPKPAPWEPVWSGEWITYEGCRFYSMEQEKTCTNTKQRSFES